MKFFVRKQTEKKSNSIYTSFSNEEWENAVNKMNDLYEEAFGERPFNRYMMTADYNYLSMKLLIRNLEKLRGD